MGHIICCDNCPVNSLFEDEIPITRHGKSARKRELVELHEGDKRYVRRDAQGELKTEVKVGRSLAQDVRQHAKTGAKKGQGDKGDE